MAEKMTQYDRVKEITDQLEAGIAELFQSDQYMQWLTTMSRFHDYSLNNTILIAMQKPDATLVAGYTAWQKQFGRQVNKGEKGIRILAPTPYKQKVEVDKTDPNTGEILKNPDGTNQKEIKEVLHPAFKVVSVFDVSQTDGRELPSLGINELTGDVAEFEIFFEALKRTCPVPMEFEEINGNAKGYYHQTERRIAIQKDMSQVQTVKTAIHEMAHQKLHALDPTKKKSDQELEELTRNGKEVEAESVAYTVCQHYGIDTSDYSFSYIAGWSHGKETPELKASLNTIRKAASEMINEIDEHMQELVAEKEALQENANAIDRKQKEGDEKSYHENEVEKSEAAFQLGDKYLEIHEASDGSWDFTFYGPNFREMDGGQIGEPGSFNLKRAAEEVCEFYNFSPDKLSEIDRDMLACLTEMYNPTKSDAHMRFVGEVVKQGFDPRAYWVNGEVMNLTALNLTQEMVDDIKYKVKIDAIPKMLFTSEQWHEIEKGIKDHFDVTVYADPAFSVEQMQAIRSGLNTEYHGYNTLEDILSIADPSKSPDQMKQELKELWKQHKEEKKQMETGQPAPTENGTYRYYSTQRPLSPGAYPKPAENQVTEIQNFDNRQLVEEGKVQAWGYVEYTKPLTAKEMQDYELKCVPVLENKVVQHTPESNLLRKSGAKAPEKRPKARKSVLEDLRSKQAQISGATAPEKPQNKHKSKEME